ncbi:MAG: tRNA (guanosine(37)-N1)-methyltransferase TrmD [Bacteroidetes bacterium]|nr:MAG: tRNA (guanosine(37)-N1)-methyltransferase TrmD [Bacteroidota bacterium]
MRIDILTCLPQLLESPLSHSILRRAQDKALLEVHVHDLRDYSGNKHRQIDDYPYGGGAGMVMKVEPIARCIRALQAERSYDEVIFLTPDGATFNQQMANELSLKQNLILLAGHYKGIDQRARDLFVTREISIGDYVLSGGELPALVVTDAIGRLIPGVLGDESSALSDSFQDQLLDAPVYTRPADFEGHRVPDVLLSGHAKKIEDWREEQALEKTRRRRPDLLDQEEG